MYLRDVRIVYYILKHFPRFPESLLNFPFQKIVILSFWPINLINKRRTNNFQSPTTATTRGTLNSKDANRKQIHRRIGIFWHFIRKDSIMRLKGIHWEFSVTALFTKSQFPDIQCTWWSPISWREMTSNDNFNTTNKADFRFGFGLEQMEIRRFSFRRIMRIMWRRLKFRQSNWK